MKLFTFDTTDEELARIEHAKTLGIDFDNILREAVRELPEDEDELAWERFFLKHPDCRMPKIEQVAKPIETTTEPATDWNQLAP